MWCCHLPDSCRHNQVLAREPFNTEQAWGNTIDFRTSNKIQRGACYCSQEGSEGDECLLLRSSNFTGAAKYFTSFHVQCNVSVTASILLSRTSRLLCELSDASTMHWGTPDSSSWSLYEFRRNAHLARIIHSNTLVTTSSGTSFFYIKIHSKKPTDFLESSVMGEQHTALPGQRSLNLISRNIPSRLY